MRAFCLFFASSSYQSLARAAQRHHCDVDDQGETSTDILGETSTEKQKEYLRGKRYLAEKKADGRPKQLAQNEQVSPGTTAERLGDEYGVSPATIRRNADFAEAVDKIGMTGQDDRGLDGYLDDDQGETSTGIRVGSLGVVDQHRRRRARRRPRRASGRMTALGIFAAVGSGGGQPLHKIHAIPRIFPSVAPA